MPAATPVLQAKNLSKRFGHKSILEDVSFELHAGQTLAVMGPSGSGKTTLLRLLAGLETLTHGQVFIQERDVTQLAPEERDLGFVFQQYALFPHMTVYDNLAFPLRLRGAPDKSIRARVENALDIVGMSGFKQRKPARLSGGEKQRIAIMRAVIYNPSTLLLDEPFAALDRHLLEQLRAELWQLRDLLQVAMVLVTHDGPFALSLADQILILNQGRLEQVGAPPEVFEQPASKFVAEFMGPINWIPRSMSLNPGSAALVGIRPGKMHIGHESGSAVGMGTLRAMQYRGSTVLLGAQVADVMLWGELPTPGAAVFQTGQTVAVSWRAEDEIHIPA